MKSPLEDGPLIVLQSAESTQDEAAARLRSGEPVGAVLARHQTKGRGRLGRVWHSGPDDSLAASLVFGAYANHKSPHLMGMGLAIAAASAIHCRLQWPNDLVFGERKVGGILTEIVEDSKGRRVPIAGLGINLRQTDFPAEIKATATSLALEGGSPREAEGVLESVLSRLALLPEPESWSVLSAAWRALDATPGKRYRMADGREAIAIGIGPDGQLICSVDGEQTAVLAADAIFGQPSANSRSV